MTGWNLPPGCTQKDLDDYTGHGELEMDEAEIAEENSYWDREFIRWVMDLEDIPRRDSDPIWIECLYSIAAAMEEHAI